MRCIMPMSRAMFHRERLFPKRTKEGKLNKPR
jgi:hypothetical protein